MNSLSSSGQYHDIDDFGTLGTEVNDVAYKLACSGDTAVEPEVPENVPDVDTHCGIETCTDTVWNTYVGSGHNWHTCGARIEWMMGPPNNYEEEEACSWVTNEYSDGCPCHSNVGLCDSYSSNKIQGDETCVNTQDMCTATAKLWGSTCDDWCGQTGLICTASWHDGSDDCEKSSEIPCSYSGMTRSICQCEPP